MNLERVKKIKNIFKKLAIVSASRTFSTFLILLLLAVIIGSILYYRYVVLIERREPEPPEIGVQFKEKLYQEISETWQDYQEELNLSEFKEYPDPFQELTE
ncbi:MAG: hypothetical protein COS47_01475 [Candidatus Nealsonbacteria bacterium CG03_land_8_20_14_0_80_36_12]|uniref:Uncharacterized protein n=1 Tax=Candidatus Nealsonbacteria bacterium CG03_land_8_20_14_0_80_36_12 TaxID=1974701 RepID=A0A2M7BY87_9BACT|nr:MAG: hypothetical protein COS47_01475 [Candidatus Nealsonbacteria bacterium CG03_land_8_20_14_0_80_36_12]